MRPSTSALRLAAAAGLLAIVGALPLAAPARAQQAGYRYSIGTQGAVRSDVGAFAHSVRSTLADRRGWSLDGRVAFSEVGSGGDFHVVLASADVVEQAGAVCSERYSCRVGDDVLINDDNWADATPAWTLSLQSYRHMVVNHELGHWFGFGHAGCPAAGELAPVMHQQSIEVDPCRPNPWPLPSERSTLAERLGLGAPAGAQSRLADDQGPVAVRGDGVLRSGPDAAAVRGSKRIDAVVQGTDGYYWTFSTGGPWTGWVALGRPPPGMVEGSRPAVTSWAPGRLDLFVRGADDKLWQRFTVDGGDSWSGWFKPVGDDGVLASAPGATALSGRRLAVYVLGIDGRIWERYWMGTQWNSGWVPQGAPGRSAAGSPSAVSHDGSAVDLFVRGGDDKLWQRSWSVRSGWSGWFRPVGNTGVLASDPEAASWSPGTLMVAVRGTDGGIWVLPRDGGWGYWARLGRPSDTFVGTPTAAARGQNRLDVLARGTDDLLYRIWVG